jgi:hypothetical protein
MMKSKSILAIVIVGSSLVLHVAQAQQPGVKGDGPLLRRKGHPHQRLDPETWDS